VLFKFIMSIHFKLTNKSVHGKVQLSLFLVRAQSKELSQSLFLSTRLIVRLLNPFADLPVRDVQWAQGKPTLTACLSGALCSMDGSTYFFGISMLPLANHSVPYFAITFACCMIFFPVSKYRFFSSRCTQPVSFGFLAFSLFSCDLGCGLTCHSPYLPHFGSELLKWVE